MANLILSDLIRALRCSCSTEPHDCGPWCRWFKIDDEAKRAEVCEALGFDPAAVDESFWGGCDVNRIFLEAIAALEVVGPGITAEQEELLLWLRAQLRTSDIWGQLAEECCELAQAALKMQRLCEGRNPPRKSEAECLASVTEERADVEVCFELLHWPNLYDQEKRKEILAEKIPRWVSVIKKAQGPA